MEILESPQINNVEQERHALEKLKQEQQRLKALEWPLQAGWFEYRVKHLSTSEVEMLAKEVALHDPSETRRQYILDGSIEIKKDALITDLIDPEGSLAGSVERQWFRSETMKQPLDTRFKEALDLIERDASEQAFEILNSYFLQSTQKH